ncbi:AF4/FMR2 family member 1 isoform X2 [Engraulis encrasicolus]|uniref:AF4/FMR2 family member 1 isoform X2 n=1 Tax=Engraulis encrasicolus TaxID=184585 RepID=UPI002FD491FC
MAAWPSLHMEERNVLRRREWERRSLEAQQQQQQEYCPDNAPLFGEPYKTKKEDELSSRIQRMLGNYEDMKDLHKNFGSMPKDPSPASVPFGRPARNNNNNNNNKPHLDPCQSRPKFQNPTPPGYRTGDPTAPSVTLTDSQTSSRKSPVLDHASSLPYSFPPHTSSSRHDKDTLDLLPPLPDIRDCTTSLPPVLSALSPPSEPLSPIHSSDSEQHDMSDSPRPPQASQPHPCSSSISISISSTPGGAVDSSHVELPLEGIPPVASESAPLPPSSQPIPLPLPSSKPPLVMPQKPTAYVRPLDGQDQVSSDSPELKPSPSDFERPVYESPPDLKLLSGSKAGGGGSGGGLAQLKIPPPSLEALSSDAQCVEEILREMTHTWPPLLTAIHTPSTADPPKFSFPNKETQHGHSGCSVQKQEAWRGSSPPPPALSRQLEPLVTQPRPSERETGSSSESESSSGSESDSESSEGEEAEQAPHAPPRSSSPPAPNKAEGSQAASAATGVNEWSLSRWLELKDHPQQQPGLGSGEAQEGGASEAEALPLHRSPSIRSPSPSPSPVCTPKAPEDTTTTTSSSNNNSPTPSPRHHQHYDSHSSPVQPESGSPQHTHSHSHYGSYNPHSSPTQQQLASASPPPTHYSFDSHHTSPARTTTPSSTPPHYAYTSHNSSLRSEAATPPPLRHYGYETPHLSPVRPPTELKEPQSSSKSSSVICPPGQQHSRSQSPSPAPPTGVVDNAVKKVTSKTSKKKQQQQHQSSGSKASRSDDHKRRHTDNSKLQQQQQPAASDQKGTSLTVKDRPKVKTKTDSSKASEPPTQAQVKSSSKSDKKASSSKRTSAEKKTTLKELAPKVTLKLSVDPKEVDAASAALLASHHPLPSFKSAKSKNGITDVHQGQTNGLPSKPKKNKKQQRRDDERPSALSGGREVNSKAAPRGAVPPLSSLVVKIPLSLLSRVPTFSRDNGPSGPSTTKHHTKPPQGGPTNTTMATANGSGTSEPTEKRTGRSRDQDRDSAAKASRKRPAEKEKEDKSQPRKKLKLDKEAKRSSSPASSSSSAPSCPAPTKPDGPKTAEEDRKESKKEKKKKKPVPAPAPTPGPGPGPGPDLCSSTQTPPAAQEPSKGPGGLKRPLADASSGGGKGASTSSQPGDATAKHKKSSGKRSEHNKTAKAPKSSFAVPEPTQPKRTPAPHRALLKVDDRQHSVEHHMKEAKKLKHKADDMSDKVSKSFIYLEAALSFVESGIAMETDPQTPKSVYTMFSETVDLIRFILKLRSFTDPASAAADKDFAVLCMKFQSLLQMAMFRFKREAALKYSRTLSDHFKSCKSSPSPRVSNRSTSTPSQMSPMASPASSSSSSGGPGSTSSCGSSGLGVSSTPSTSTSAPSQANTVALPQSIHQVASSYVSITALFLSAHSTWEQAEELAHKGTGVLLELDSAVGSLTLLSSMRDVVRYTRQGLHWLRQDSQKTL